MLPLILISALMMLASSAPLVYKASLTPVQGSKSSGSVSLSIFNSTYGSGYFFATNINQMTQAVILSEFDILNMVNTSTTVPRPLFYAFNATYGPISGSVKVSFAFNPSMNNASVFFSLNAADFVIVTTSHPFGELGCNLKLTSGGSPSPSSSLSPALDYAPTQSKAKFSGNKANCLCGKTKNPLTWFSYGASSDSSCLCENDNCDFGVYNSCGYGLSCERGCDKAVSTKCCKFQSNKNRYQ